MTEPVGNQPADHQPDEPAPTIHLPRPTAWPAVMAAGITMVMAGIITSVFFSLVGIVVFAIALAGWIGELRRG
ncbi:MAG: hypothetical protein ACRDIY_21520 [Chloroflexota bacterium]